MIFSRAIYDFWEISLEKRNILNSRAIRKSMGGLYIACLFIKQNLLSI